MSGALYRDVNTRRWGAYLRSGEILTCVVSGCSTVKLVCCVTKQSDNDASLRVHSHRRHYHLAAAFHHVSTCTHINNTETTHVDRRYIWPSPETAHRYGCFVPQNDNSNRWNLEISWWSSVFLRILKCSRVWWIEFNYCNHHYMEVNDGAVAVMQMSLARLERDSSATPPS